jgi:polyisoprenyl-phosphate glycosyltransferase
MALRVEIVTSALNEEANVHELYNQLESAVSSLEIQWSLIYFDNGSTDRTWEEILKLSNQKNNVVGYRMARNFGLDYSFSAGIDLASADALIIMASDLQDPPSSVADLVRVWLAGNPHVAVRVHKRSEMPFIRKWFTKIFYKINNWASDGLIPENVSDFRLMDRVVYEAVRAMPERNRFLRGMVAWTGFPTVFVDIDRPPRFQGKTKTNFIDLFRFSVSGILANSQKPIQIISFFGFISSFFAFLLVSIFSIAWLFFGVPFAGFGTIVGFIVLTFSITIGILGLIGEYVGLIYAEVKRRPNYIIWSSTLDTHEKS